MATFKDRIKLLREESHLTQKELGSKIDKSESTINMYESGKREPKTSEDYKRIADYFDVTLDYLLGRAKTKKGIISEATIDGHPYKFELDSTVFPNGLTYEQMVQKLKVLEKLEKAGFKYDSTDEK